MANLRQTLYAWRDNEASKRGVDLFRILPNSALDEIVKVLPRTKEELTAIKGIKDAKFQHYGKAIFAIVDEHVGGGQTSKSDVSETTPGVIQARVLERQEESPYSVSAYLDIVNSMLWRVSARVKGEVTSFKFQGSAVYMGIKDEKDESIMNVFMWLSDYEACAVEIVEGLEVIVEGKSEIYKPSGRFSFRAQTIELVGEGALKAAYDKLMKKLELEGVFAADTKRVLLEFPEHVGLVTSKTGAVIHDFLNNLGKFGFKVEFVNSRVEGASAVKDLLAAMRYFKTRPIDVLVLIRGGGSLESLQAFNNELVVRAIKEFPVPVICAIGHDKDVPLAQLAADAAPSTPTACTALLNASWEQARGELRISEKVLMGSFAERLWQIKTEFADSQTRVMNYFSLFISLFQTQRESIRVALPMLKSAMTRMKKETEETMRITHIRFGSTLGKMKELLEKIVAELVGHDPMRQLKLGYSILSQGGKILRSAEGKQVGEHFEARLSDGTLEATINAVSSKKLPVAS